MKCGMLKFIIAMAVLAGAASAGLTLLGFKGSPILVGGEWTSEGGMLP